MKKILFIIYLLGVVLTTNAADRYWIASATANWNSTANWSTTSGGAGGASVPGSSDRAIFNGSGLGRCNINSNVTVLNFLVHNGYNDSIVQQSGNTITIASNGSFDFSGGSFIGGNSNITVAGTFTLDSNALFTSTSAVLSIRGNTSIDDGDDFTHNSGTFTFYSVSGGSVITADMDTIVLYKLIIDGSAADKKITFDSDNEITVANDYTLTSGAGSFDIGLFAGKIFAKNDVYVDYYRSTDYGQGTNELIIDGDDTQIIDATGNSSGALFKITINKDASDTLKFKQPLNIHNNLTLQSGIAIFESTSTIKFYYSSTIDGNFEFNDVIFYAYNASANQNVTWNVNDTLIINDDLFFDGNALVYLLGGEIHCKGDLDLSQNTVGNSGTSSTWIGTTKIYFDSNSNQSWIGRSSRSYTWMPIIIIDKSGGTLSISNNITISNQLHYIQGTIDYGTSNLEFIRSCKITGNDISLYKVTIFPPISYASAIALNDTTLLTVNNTLKFDISIYNDAAYFSSGKIHSKGDVTVTNTRLGGGNNYKITFNGTGNQTLTGSGVAHGGYLSSIEINKSSGILYLSSIICLYGKWELKNGTIDASTYSSTLYFNTNFTPTIKGNQTLNKLHIRTDGASHKFIVANGTTITLESELSGLSTGTCVIDSGTIEVKGNFASLTPFNGGTGTIKAIGTANQTFTGTTSLTTGELPNFTINKSSGTFTVTNYLNVAKALTLTSGVITTANSSSKVHLIDNATLSGGSTSSYVDGIVSKLGNDAFTFPTGENGLYRPLTITAPSSTSDRFEVEYKNAAQVLGTTFDTAYVEISANEYWQFSRSVGSSTVKATMAWSNNKYEIPGDSTTIGSLYWTGSTWSGLTTDLLTGNATTGSLRTATLGTYSYLVLGKKKEKNVFATTQYQLDGGFYKTKTKRLYVRYKGEYNASKFRFNIYDEDNDIVANESTAGVVDRYYVKEGDNRFIFNFSPNGYAIPAGFYILEIINDKNEKQYLRFQKSQ